MIEKIRARMAEAQAKREAIKKQGPEALLRLCKVAQGDSGQCRHVRRFLLGLYNSHKWPFELIRLRNLDSNLLDDCLAVLELDMENLEQMMCDLLEIWRPSACAPVFSVDAKSTVSRTT